MNHDAILKRLTEEKNRIAGLSRTDYIRYLWDTALAPLPDDPFLAARKRDQAIMRALVNGEVLPTTKHHLFSRAEKHPLNMDERRTIKEAQTVLEELCPKYTDAFREYDQEDLTRQIKEMEDTRTAQIEERREIARLAHRTEVQDHLFFALTMIHKFCPDPKIKKQIEDGTRQIKELWEERYANKNAANYAEVADRTDETCQGYVKLLNDLYGMDYTPAADKPNEPKPDEQGGARSIEQNRITNEDLMQMLVAMSQNGVPTSGFKGDAQTDILKIASGRLRDIKSVSGLQKDNNELKAKLAQGKTE